MCKTADHARAGRQAIVDEVRAYANDKLVGESVRGRKVHAIQWQAILTSDETDLTQNAPRL